MKIVKKNKLQKIRVSVVKSQIANLIIFVDYSSDNGVELYYIHFRNFIELLIKNSKLQKWKQNLLPFKAGLPKESNSNVTSLRVTENN